MVNKEENYNEIIKQLMNDFIEENYYKKTQNLIESCQEDIKEKINNQEAHEELEKKWFIDKIINTQFNIVIRKIQKVLEDTGTIINFEDYDGVIVKQFESTDTSEYSSGNVSHIALTSDMMEMFPRFISKKYYDLAVESLKNYFYCNIPISLKASNIYHLTEHGTKKMSNKKRVDQNIDTFAVVSYRWYTSSSTQDRSEQLQLSMKTKDGVIFVSFRHLIYLNNFFILLKCKNEFKYEAYSIVPDSEYLNDVTFLTNLKNNYYYSREETPILANEINVGIYNEVVLNSNIISNHLEDFQLNPPSLVKQICASLGAGQNIILDGVPGTGKTHLATKIAEEAMGKDGYILTTATSDWTTFDTIGGLMPNKDGELEFKEGKFLQAIRENKWLIIDEINRADIDKAFGQLFTVLSGKSVELPYTINNKPVKIIVDNNLPFNQEINGTYYIGKNWRIIGTMNSYDKNTLFDLSYAFMRRFRFIDVEVPKDYDGLKGSWEKNIEYKNIIKKTKNYNDKLEKLYRINYDPKFNGKDNINRNLGPAIFMDILKYINSRLYIEGNEQYNNEIFSEAINAYVIPQFEGLNSTKLGKVEKFFTDYVFNNEDENDNADLVIRKLNSLRPNY